jgi:hypothetical protein
MRFPELSTKKMNSVNATEIDEIVKVVLGGGLSARRFTCVEEMSVI